MEKFRKKPKLSIIAAVGQNRELGKNGDLIWRISDDLKRLKSLTMGHPIIMGRKTYESIGKPLLGRTNIVISKNTELITGCEVFSTIEKAINFASSIDDGEIFVFGGSSIYDICLPITDRLYLTCIEAIDKAADTFFPEFSEFTKIISEETGSEGHLKYIYKVLERQSN